MITNHRSALAIAGVALALILAGCTDADPVGVPDAAQQTAVLPASTLHFSSSGSAAARPVQQTSSGMLWPIGFCDEAAGVARMWIEGSGTASHVGRFSIGKSMCLDPTTGAVTDGDGMLVAANGDRIHMEFIGQLVELEPPTFELLYAIVGGTGRFENAAGELAIRTVLTSETTWTSSGSGWMSYDASDRSVR
jgi:hypothetical protein